MGWMLSEIGFDPDLNLFRRLGPWHASIHQDLGNPSRDLQRVDP
jgi:hypothetical protein